MVHGDSPFHAYMRFELSSEAREYSPNTRNVAWDLERAGDDDELDSLHWNQRRGPAGQVQSADPPASSSAATEGKIGGLDAVRKHAEDKEQKAGGGDDGEKAKCTVCMERAVCVSFAPCNHVASCATCALKALEQKPCCVTCRATVTSVSVHHVQSV